MKNNQYAGLGNEYEYGAREYDTRRIGWLTPDPLASKYPGISPYVFCLNNPIIFHDGDGRVVLGSDGKPVTYSKDDKGTITWSSNATADVKKVGEAMIKTPSGEAAFNRWQDAKTNVTIVIDKENNPPDKFANTEPTSFDDKKRPITNDDGQYESITVTFYDKGIQQERAPGAGKRYENTDEDEAYGAIGTHEEGHNNKDQIKRDNKQPLEIKQDKKRTIPFHQEIDYRREYHEKNPGKPNEKTWEKHYQDAGYDTKQKSTDIPGYNK